MSVLSFLFLPLVLGQATKMQNVPSNAPADNQFNNSQPQLVRMPDLSNDHPDDSIYGTRDIDLPFGRLYHGNMKYFAPGQLNTPTDMTDQWAPGVNDFANQSACGIPDSAYQITKVAIHPYFLKYAPLERYCMQDVCISFWKEDGSQDMMLKVTDICSTDPTDPTHCETPADIKVDRTKTSIMEGQVGKPVGEFPDFAKDKNAFPAKTWWFFMKCWGDGTAQPAYAGPGTDNWFTTPYYPNNLKWAQDAAAQQYTNNQNSYPGKGWPTYPQGEYNTNRNDQTSPPIDDWVKGEEPAWTPIAGGRGWGQPLQSNSNSTTTGGSVGSSDNSTTIGGASGGSGGSGSFPSSNTTTFVTSTSSSVQPSTTGASNSAGDDECGVDTEL